MKRDIVDLNTMQTAIFDLDGTLLDSAWVWDKVDLDFLGNRGFEVPDDYTDAIAHMGSTQAAVYTKARFGLKESIDSIVAEWIDMARYEYANDVVCKDGVKDYLKLLNDAGIKMGVATSSDRELFMKALEREKILDYFDTIVTVHEVKRSKGFPDVYEKACKNLGGDVDRSVVYEDILAGVTGAKSGGFGTVAVYDEKSEHKMEEIKEAADIYVMNFNELC